MALARVFSAVPTAAGLDEHLRDACSNDNLVLLVGSNARACAYMSRHLKAWSRKNSQANELRSSMLTGASVQEVCASESHWPEPGKRVIVIVIRVEVAAPRPFVTPSSLTSSLVEKFAADKAAGNLLFVAIPGPAAVATEWSEAPTRNNALAAAVPDLSHRTHTFALLPAAERLAKQGAARNTALTARVLQAGCLSQVPPAARCRWCCCGRSSSRGAGAALEVNLWSSLQAKAHSAQLHPEAATKVWSCDSRSEAAGSVSVVAVAQHVKLWLQVDAHTRRAALQWPVSSTSGGSQCVLVVRIQGSSAAAAAAFSASGGATVQANPLAAGAGAGAGGGAGAGAGAGAVCELVRACKDKAAAQACASEEMKAHPKHWIVMLRVDVG